LQISLLNLKITLFIALALASKRSIVYVYFSKLLILFVIPPNKLFRKPLKTSLRALPSDTATITGLLILIDKMHTH